MLLSGFSILFNRILDSDLPSWKELAIHLGNSQIWWIEIVIADKSMTFASPILWISINFSTDDYAEITKCIVQQLLVHLRV